MSQLNIRVFVYFCLLAVLAGVGNCWSTIIVESCVTKSQKNPGKTPKTVTVTRTRYVQEISTVAITPTDVVAYSTTTESVTVTAAITTYTGTTTITSSYAYSGLSYTRLILNTTTTDVVIVTLGETTTTVPLPSGFTPAAANPTTTAAPPIRIAFAAADEQADVGRVVCTEKHILSTTVTTTVTAAVVTVTESSAVATTYISDITTITVPDETTSAFYSYTFIPTGTSTYTTVHRTVVITTSTSISVATATAYPACAANNLISAVNATNIIGGFRANSVPLELNMTDPYSCCVACQQMDRCTGSVFYIPNSDDYYTYNNYDSNCFLFTVEIGKKCRPAKKAGWAYFTQSPYIEYPDTWFVSNGQCGQGYLTSQY